MDQWLSRPSCALYKCEDAVRTRGTHTHTPMRMYVHVPCACRLFMIIGWFTSAWFTSGAKWSRGVTHITSNLCLNGRKHKEQREAPYICNENGGKNKQTAIKLRITTCMSGLASSFAVTEAPQVPKPGGKRQQITNLIFVMKMEEQINKELQK